MKLDNISNILKLHFCFYISTKKTQPFCIKQYLMTAFYTGWRSRGRWGGLGVKDGYAVSGSDLSVSQKSFKMCVEGEGYVRGGLNPSKKLHNLLWMKKSTIGTSKMIHQQWQMQLLGVGSRGLF